MDNQKLLWIIIIMGVVMLCCRVIPIIFFKNKIKNKFLKSFLAYVPYAVLTSMTFPEVFRSTSSVISAAIGVVLAVVLAYFGQSLIVVALSSAALVFIVEQIMNFVK